VTTMRARLPRAELEDALTAIATVTGGRTTKPIFGCTRLSVAADAVELAGTDGEVALRVEAPVLAVEREGEAVLAADRFLAIVRELADVELVIEADEHRCTIVGQGSDFRLPVQNVADFPPIGTFPAEPDLVIDGRQLRRMIELTAYAAAREASRYAINGVLWQKRGKVLYLVATDGRRLARAGGAVARSEVADFELIVPTKALAIFERVFAPPKGEPDWSVEVGVLPNQLVLRSGRQMLLTGLVEGRFPKYDDVIPKDNDKVAVVGREELYGAVRRAALVTTEDSRAVRLSFDTGSLVVTAQSPEQGEARLDIPVDYRGEKLTIGFNPAFLADALKAFSGDRVQIEMRESFRPAVMSGGDKEEFLYVVMPVSLPG
jgi:DNA polymerase-3 subunit beta